MVSNSRKDGSLSVRIREIDHKCESAFVSHGVTVEVARTRADLEAAYNLLYEQYLEYGYTDHNPQRMRVNKWNAMPTTYTVIAKKDDIVIGTVTLIGDNPEKLPSDEIAEEELEKLREQGKKLIEVSGLAVHPTLSDSSTVSHLFRYITMLGRQFLGGTDFIITVNPKHAAFYVKRICCVPITGEREYTKVKNAPGISMRLNLETMPKVYHARHSKRTGDRNLHWFFFVDAQEEMYSGIETSLEGRKELFKKEFVEDFFYNFTKTITDRNKMNIITRSWNFSRPKSVRLNVPAGKKSRRSSISDDLFTLWENSIGLPA